MKSKKDIHDYMHIYGMLVLTALIAYAAIHTIPNQIRESNSWNKVYYEEALPWLNGHMEFDDPYEIVTACEKLLDGETRNLNQTKIVCKDGKINYVSIKKVSGECLENSRELISQCT
jgi:hypothetical protein